jgi:gluconolactonase
MRDPSRSRSIDASVLSTVNNPLGVLGVLGVLGGNHVFRVLGGLRVVVSSRPFQNGVSSAAMSTRDYSPGAAPIRYPDPDIIALDPRFNALRVGNTTIERIWTGALWAEGPAWNAQGRYLLWSDIPNNRQLRWLEEDGHVSTFRQPTGNSNGNTFDHQGRQVSCEHRGRRVVRYEWDGSVTVIAASFNGKPLNSPNDVVVHPDGSIWFTDPPYGTRAEGGYEGIYAERHHPNSVYRADLTTGLLQRLIDDIPFPNGICFSHDYKRLYIVNTGPNGDIRVYDIVNDIRVANGRIFHDMKFGDPGNQVQGGSDGMRVDIHGNVWAAAGGGEGIDGVQIITPEGERIGQILLPERCANVCFGGEKRNRLFMTASQSVYSVYVNTRGAHPS